MMQDIAVATGKGTAGAAAAILAVGSAWISDTKDIISLIGGILFVLISLVTFISIIFDILRKIDDRKDHALRERAKADVQIAKAQGIKSATQRISMPTSQTP